MNEDMAHYDRLPADDKKTSYQFLIDAARRYVNRKRGESNKHKLMQSLRGQELAVQAAVVKPKAKGICFAYQRGQCQAGDECKWSHEPAVGKPLPLPGAMGGAAKPMAKGMTAAPVPPPAKAEWKTGSKGVPMAKPKGADGLNIVQPKTGQEEQETGPPRKKCIHYMRQRGHMCFCTPA